MTSVHLAIAASCYHRPASSGETVVQQQHSARFTWRHMTDLQCFRYCQGSGFEYAVVQRASCWCTWQEDDELLFDEGYDDSDLDLWWDHGNHCDGTCEAYSDKSCGGTTDGFFVYDSGTLCFNACYIISMSII
jgi:hypothetical protein